MKNNYLNFLIVVIFLVVGFFLIKQPSENFNSENKPENIKYVKIAGQDIKVDLALTVTEQERGLAGRNGLKENEGMLFVFPQPGNYPFWMKGMNFPIDIIWLSEDLKVVYIKKDARPESYPELFGPEKNQQDAQYVLEIASGFSDKNNLQVGDSALFTY